MSEAEGGRRSAREASSAGHSLIAGADAEGAAEPAGSNGEPAGHAAEVEALRAELAVAEEQARSQRELYLRAAAEIDNVRKRAQRDIEQAHRYALESFASELLGVLDSLRLAGESAANADAATLAAGQEATLKLLQRAFEKVGIRQLDPAGEPFDPHQHEAMLMQESPEAAPNTVLQVIQPGYELNGRLLRPARVIVAKAPAGAGGP
jgi:molecular chaperone GrpE